MNKLVVNPRFLTRNQINPVDFCKQFGSPTEFNTVYDIVINTKKNVYKLTHHKNINHAPTTRLTKNTNKL